MFPTNSWREFPKGSGNLRCNSVFRISPSFGDDGHIVAGIEKCPSSLKRLFQHRTQKILTNTYSEACNTAANNQDALLRRVWVGCSRLTLLNDELVAKASQEEVRRGGDRHCCVSVAESV